MLKNLRFFYVVLVLLVCCGFARGETNDYKGKVFLGIRGKNIPVPENPGYESKFGVLVKNVAVGSSAAAAGLNAGDIIISIDGAVWKSKQIRLSRSFGKAGSKATPGQRAELMVLRQNESDPKSYRLEKIVLTLLPYPRTAAEKPSTPTNDEMRSDLKGVHPIYETFCWELVNKYGFQADTEDLLKRIARCQLLPDNDRLAMMRYMHRDPFKLEAVSRKMIDSLRSQSADSSTVCKAMLRQSLEALVTFDERKKQELSKDASRVIEPTYKGKDLQAHLDYIANVLEEADKLNKKAFAKLSKQEIEHIKKHREGLLDSFVQFKMLSYDPDKQRQEASYKLLMLADKVDIASLIRQAELTALLIEPGFTKSLQVAAEKSGKNLNASVIARKNTPFGLIIVSGKQRMRHVGNYAAVYDLGGDDVYANNQGASVPGKIPSAVIVDYSGDDSYESTNMFTQGCGNMGVGILCDLAGDDNYIALSYSQGASFMGVGILIDKSGNDVYRGIKFHQGVGHWGAGLLADMGGNDRYESHIASQGVGLPGGFGLIYENGGDDSYYCKGLQLTGYGTSGTFEGWGQAVGFGYRPYASGGIGVIFDNSGTDRIEGGNFVQGGGYYYGAGVLYCGGKEDDVYIGSRYAQGFSAHQAVGVMIEEGGNDRYQTRNFVAQGLAWDESVTLFIDQAGDDIYEGGSFSQCASAMNGFAIFLELGGKDTYLYDTPCKTGGNSYHDGKSLSFFVDAGGDQDIYTGRKNNNISPGKGNRIFCDLPGDIKQALDTKPIIRGNK